MPTRRFSSKMTRSSEQADRVKPIEEDDLNKVRGLLRRNPDLKDYVESLCFFRMADAGHIPENKAYEMKLREIVDRLNLNKGYGLAKLPEDFEEAKKVIVRIKERPHFERIIREAKSV